MVPRAWSARYWPLTSRRVLQIPARVRCIDGFAISQLIRREITPICETTFSYDLELHFFDGAVRIVEAGRPSRQHDAQQARRARLRYEPLRSQVSRGALAAPAGGSRID